MVDREIKMVQLGRESQPGHLEEFDSLSLEKPRTRVKSISVYS